MFGQRLRCSPSIEPYLGMLDGPVFKQISFHLFHPGMLITKLILSLILCYKAMVQHYTECELRHADDAGSRQYACIPDTDRQTDILLTEKKSHYRLICHRNERDIYIPICGIRMHDLGRVVSHLHIQTRQKCIYEHPHQNNIRFFSAFAAYAAACKIASQSGHMESLTLSYFVSNYVACSIRHSLFMESYLNTVLVWDNTTN